MKKYTLYVGLNDKDLKIQVIPTEKALKIVESELYDRFDGATVYLGNGLYKHDNDEKVKENTIIIELLDFNNNDSEMMINIKKLVQTLKLDLNQESIAFQVINVESMLL